jgi:hypothetical protein
MFVLLSLICYSTLLSVSGLLGLHVTKVDLNLFAFIIIIIFIVTALMKPGKMTQASVITFPGLLF